MDGWGGSYFRTREGFPVRYRDTNIRTLFTRGPCVHRVYQLTAASLFTWSVIPSIARTPVISEVAASRTRASSTGAREEFPRWFPTMSIDRTPLSLSLSLRLLYRFSIPTVNRSQFLPIFTFFHSEQGRCKVDPCHEISYEIWMFCIANNYRRLPRETHISGCTLILDKGQGGRGMKRVRWRKVEKEGRGEEEEEEEEETRPGREICGIVDVETRRDAL